MQKASRTQDYLYDSNYTVASRNDHHKALAKANSTNVVTVPVHGNMFSSLSHYPAKQYTLVAQKGNSTTLGNDRRNYFRGAPGEAPGLVTGMNRYRYFKRPLIPYTPSLGAAVLYSKKPVVVEEVGKLVNSC
jgi:hypothetical protein